MLIDILRMPPVFGFPIDRRAVVLTGHNQTVRHNGNVYRWQHLNTHHHPTFSVGSLLEGNLRDLFKIIHVSDDPLDPYVFETVMAMEGTDCFCLYSKIISPYRVDIGVSLNAIRVYRFDDYAPSKEVPALPLSHIVSPYNAPPLVYSGSSNQSLTVIEKVHHIHEIVPPVLGEINLWQYVNYLLEVQKGKVLDSRLGIAYKPLHDYAPGVLTSLIEGRFERLPFHETRSSHPAIHLEPDKWFSYAELKFRIKEHGFENRFNDPAFDAVVLRLIHLTIPSFSVSAMMDHAIDGIAGVWLWRHYYHPYQWFLGNSQTVEENNRKALSDILFQCAMIYCKLYDIDSQVFMAQTHSESSITVVKNTHDEIAIIVHDLIHDRYVCFYYSFPGLALATLSVGWYS